MSQKTAASPSELRFDPEAHKYWIGKKRIPGVSEILQKIGLTKDFKGVDPFYRDRGIATHKAIELFLSATLDLESLDPAVKPCFDAFKSYWGTYNIGRILAFEKPMADLSESFAGTPDLVTDKGIWDWKCSKSHDKVAELQGQAYNLLAFHLGHSHVYRPFIVVELHDDGTFEEFNYGNEVKQWDSVMNLYRWRTGKNEESKD